MIYNCYRNLPSVDALGGYAAEFRVVLLKFLIISMILASTMLIGCICCHELFRLMGVALRNFLSDIWHVNIFSHPLIGCQIYSKIFTIDFNHWLTSYLSKVCKNQLEKLLTLTHPLHRRFCSTVLHSVHWNKWTFIVSHDMDACTAYITFKFAVDIHFL